MTFIFFFFNIICISAGLLTFLASQWLKCRPDGISLKNLQYRQDGTVAAKL